MEGEAVIDPPPGLSKAAAGLIVGGTRVTDLSTLMIIGAVDAGQAADRLYPVITAVKAAVALLEDAHLELSVQAGRPAGSTPDPASWRSRHGDPDYGQWSSRNTWLARHDLPREEPPS
jgi:hypothetical protein